MPVNRVSPRESVERDRLTSVAGSDELKTLWISDRILRLAEYQDIVERINEQVAELRDVDDENPYDPVRQPLRYEAWQPPKPQRIPAMLLKMKIEALRTAAEELGQLPNETPAEPDQLKYRVEGVNVEGLT